jgi:hypothetical protein
MIADIFYVCQCLVKRARTHLSIALHTQIDSGDNDRINILIDQEISFEEWV